MRTPSLPTVLVASLIAAFVLLGLQKAGYWGQPARVEPPPPTPAALAFRRAQAEAEAAQDTAARLAEVQQPAETIEVLPEGEGRDATFALCTACHSTAIIRRSRFSRERWDELLDWMTEVQGMAPLEGAAREEVLDYLARSFPPETAPGGGRRATNPFLND